jgi:hypothetical protein
MPQAFGKLRAKKETVTQALTEFIQRRRQREILKALGTIDKRRAGNLDSVVRGSRA